MAESIVVTVDDTQETVSLFVDSGNYGVTSFEGRTGVVVAVTGDYRASQVTNAFDTSVDDTDDIVEGSTNKFNLDSEVGTGVSLKLTNQEGTLYNMSSANSGTTYTTAGTTLNAYARCLINAASEPTVTGGTKITGSTFVISTDMYLTVWYNGNRVEYWFETI